MPSLSAAPTAGYVVRYYARVDKVELFAYFFFTKLGFIVKLEKAHDYFYAEPKRSPDGRVVVCTILPRDSAVKVATAPSARIL